MGYRSQVALKTTTEGYLLFKMFDDSIEAKEEKPLAYMHIEKTPTGFYKISHDDIKWYESYKDIQNFMKMLDTLTEQDIPYKFIRIGEDEDDIEIHENYTKDIPDQIADFCISVEILDDDEDNYEEV